MTPISRRRFLASLCAAAAQGVPAIALSQDAAPLTRTIPASGERLPVIGLGTWITFNVAPAPATEAALVPVMRTFFDRGGAMVDSSPMYGLSLIHI